MSFFDPEEFLNKLNLKPDLVVAEFGAGAGNFTIPLAKRLPQGRVYAFEIQPEYISALKGRADLEGVINIEVRLANLEEPHSTKLADESLDMVFIPNMLFQTERDDIVIEEAKRILKSKGKLVIIDWLPTTEKGPAGKRIDPEKLQALLVEKGFKIEKFSLEGKYHFSLLAVKVS